jgi:ParB-like nuclease domain
MAVAERPELDEAEDTRERVVVWDTQEVLYVHPVASLFPMMSEEELDDLAADIKANGLIHPIVLDQHRQLTDGRNRLEGCRRAGVSPDFIVTPLDDPIAFILSANVSRRHLTKGQQAMAVAKARVFLKDDEKRRTGKDSLRWLAKDSGVSRARLGYAQIVLEYAPEYADAVLFRGMPLNEAYAKAEERKAAAQSDEAKLEALKVEAPELAELVVDERLTLAGALAELQERRRKERVREEEEQQRRETTTSQVIQAVALFDPGRLEPNARAAQLRRRLDGAFLAQSGGMGDLSRQRLSGCRAVMDELITLLEAEPISR